MTVITDTAKKILNDNAIRYRTRKIGRGTPDGFVGGDTLRAFRPKPLPGSVIRPLFVVFGRRLDAFVKKNPVPTRPDFDAFHAKEVLAFHAAITAGGVWSAGQNGDLPDGSAYNVYAKVLNLIQRIGAIGLPPDFQMDATRLGALSTTVCMFRWTAVSQLESNRLSLQVTSQA